MTLADADKARRRIMPAWIGSAFVHDDAAAIPHVVTGVLSARTGQRAELRT
jgi:hypothetical protein